jgi:hypothetical protein
MIRVILEDPLFEEFVTHRLHWNDLSTIRVCTLPFQTVRT